LSTRSRAILLIHRVLLRTARPPLDRLWALAYRLVARAWVAYLARGEPNASAYVRGSIAAGDALPGLSDVDVALVLPEDQAGAGRARERATARWLRLRRAFRLTDLLLDYPLILEEPELREVVGSSAPTHPRPTYLGAAFVQDKARMLERPGLYGATGDWRRLRGPERRPAESARDPQLRRIAAWLELSYWWQWAFPVCADPAGPRTASLCVKLVAEPARIWLWLVHGERAGGRVDTLERALRVLPEEEQALRHALDLHRSLTSSPRPPLAEVIPFLVRLSERIAARLDEEVAEHGATEVRLVGLEPLEVVHPHGGPRSGVLPLCDWKGLVFPRMLDELFLPAPGGRGDWEVLGRATAADTYGAYAAFRIGGLMLLPAARSRTTMRAVMCRAADPALFAVQEGRATAAFPNVPGWSVRDTARRAVVEHLAWLRTPHERGGETLGTLFSAARAALVLESLQDGDPELPLTVTETARQLAARSETAPAVVAEGLGNYREFAVHRTPPPAATLSAMRALVAQLPAYAGELDALGDNPGLLAIEK
jgi:nucleotidyltransferase-like protein